MRAPLRCGLGNLSWKQADDDQREVIRPRRASEMMVHLPHDLTPDLGGRFGAPRREDLLHPLATEKVSVGVEGFGESIGVLEHGVSRLELETLGRVLRRDPDPDWE